ncbi:MAG: PH domain-containing protein [Micavibrio sp.]|nr:PH domain-containing protein [Micavibrio sp.]
MLYVEQSLGPNEELVHVGKFHWFYTVQAYMAIVWGVIGSILFISASSYIYKNMGYFPPDLSFLDTIRYLHPGFRIFAFIIFILGVMSFAQMLVIKATTEIAVTNSRLVYKRGLIARNVGEISIDRIEGVNVLQTILGRIFNFGRLAVRGMGVGEVILPPIEDPITFRQAIERAKSI